jgi:hypothetical protein
VPKPHQIHLQHHKSPARPACGHKVALGWITSDIDKVTCGSCQRVHARRNGRPPIEEKTAQRNHREYMRGVYEEMADQLTLDDHKETIVDNISLKGPPGQGVPAEDFLRHVRALQGLGVVKSQRQKDKTRQWALTPFGEFVAERISE